MTSPHQPVGPVDATRCRATRARHLRPPAPHRRGDARRRRRGRRPVRLRRLLPARRPVRSGPHPRASSSCCGPTTRGWTSSRSPCSRWPTPATSRSTRSTSPRRSPPSSERSDELRDGGTKLITLGGDHTIALPLLRSLHRDHGPIAVLHFDAHLDTWDTYFGAPFTHGTPFRRASEEGLLDPEHCLHVGIRGPLYASTDLSDDRVLGFQVHRHRRLPAGRAGRR